MLEVKELLQFIAQPFTDYMSDMLKIPISLSSTWIFLTSLAILFFLWGVVFRNFFILEKKIRLLVRLLLTSGILILSSYLVFIQINNVIENVKSSDVIISKLYNNANQLECNRFSESLESDLYSSLANKKTFYFDWVMKKYNDSILSSLIKPSDRPLIAIGGSCEINDKFGQYSIEFKILRPVKKIELPNILNGSTNKFKKEEMESYKVQARTADAIRNTVITINALLYECQGNCHKAVTVYTELLSSIGRENKEVRAEIYKRLSAVYYSLNELENAENTISEGVKEQPDSENLRLARAEYYLINKKVNLAMEDLNRIKPNSKNNELRLFYLSGALPMMGKYIEASKLLDKYGKAEVDDPELIANVAYSAMVISDLDKANNLVSLALTKDSRNFSALNLSGLVKGKLGDYSNSLQAYDMAIEVAPQRTEAYANKAMTLLDLNRNEEALSSVNKSIALGNESSEAYLNKAIAFSRISNESKSIEEAFNIAINKQLDNPNAYIYRGLYYKSIGRLNNAINDFQHASSLDANRALAYISLAEVYILQNRQSKALRSLEKAIKSSDSSHYQNEILNLKKEFAP